MKKAMSVGDRSHLNDFIKLMIVSILLLLFMPVNAKGTYINIISPNGGEILVRGTTHTVQWETDLTDSGYVQIDLYENMQFVDEIAVTTCSGSYDWVVGENIPKSDKCGLMIKSCSQPDIFDISNGDFMIEGVPEVPVLISPEYDAITENKRPLFSWHSLYDASEYRIIISTDSDFIDFNQYASADSFFVPLADMADNTYWWKISAINEHGESGFSEVRKMTVKQRPEIPVLTSPANDSYISDRKPAFEWVSALNADKYEILISNNENFLVPDSFQTDNSFFTTPADLEYAIYWWKVKSINIAGESEFSSASKFTIMALPDVPWQTLPENGSEFTSETVMLAWNPVASAVKYIINLKDSSGDVFETDVLDTNYVVNIKYGKYWWRVKAVNLAGEGEWSINYMFTNTAFTYIESGLPDLAGTSSDWGDYDNDGLLDIALSGTDGSYYFTRVYKNNGDGTFSNINADLSPVYDGKLVWFDYNNDGWLDLLVAGDGNVTDLFKNNGNGTFTKLATSLKGVANGSADCGDYDNDGFSDIIITGRYDEPYPGNYITRIYHNNHNGTFSEIDSGINGTYSSDVKWCDINNDGCLDIIITGESDSGSMKWVCFNNGDGSFTQSNLGFQGNSGNSIACGDYNNDGNIDILINESGGSYIYTNNGEGIFNSTTINLEGGDHGSAEWGDFDSDGWLDIIVTGIRDNMTIAKIYRNNCNGTFTDIFASLPGTYSGSANWADYDNDGRLDVFISGFFNTSGSRVSILYKNISISNNTHPVKPSNLTAVVNGDAVTLSWDRSSDNETPQVGLSYNIYIGTSPHNCNIVSSLSSAEGQRRTTDIGNSGEVNSHVIKWLGTGTYFWSVQAIDNSFSGSEFSEEKSFKVGSIIPSVPVALEATAIDRFSFRANWNQTGDAGYFIELSSDSIFTLPVEGYENVNAFNKNYYTYTELQSDRTYYYRVRSYNADSLLSGYSNVIKVLSLHNPFEDINAGITATGEAAWGDYNNDMNLDLIIGGKLLKNNGDGTFSDANAGLPGATLNKWADFDNDGYLDLLLLAWNSSKIYKNYGNGIFTDINAGLECCGTADCSDFNKDGFIDIVICDFDTTRIYKNNGDGTFTNTGADFPGIDGGSAAWGDFNNDTYPDLILTGLHWYYEDEQWKYYPISNIYKNNCNGTFSEIESGIMALYNSSAAWGDYDNDGYLDLLIAGAGNFKAYRSVIYRNNGDGTFTITAYLTGIADGSAAWADYNTDGYLDVLLTGFTNNYPVSEITEIYQNYGDGIFACIDPTIPGVEHGSAAWGDYDNDGKLDIAVTGRNHSGSVQYSRIYHNKNYLISNNTNPLAPDNLISDPGINELSIIWNKASDNETPVDGLSYNVYIGTSPYGGNVISPMSDIATGFRKIAVTGNMNGLNQMTITGLSPGNYYWSVQTVDQCFAGSEFAAEQSVVVTGIETDEILPSATELHQNYPNPFNPSTEISYSLKSEGLVTLSVFNTKGELVSTLVNEKKIAGNHTVNFNADGLNSGIYFYKLNVDGKLEDAKRMLMIK